jgi:hypothetical protein
LSQNKSLKINFIMKKFAQIHYAVTLIILVMAVISFSGCDKSDEPSPELSAAEKQIQSLVGQWNINSVKVDGVDYTNLFTGFTLTFSHTPAGYIPANGGKVWATPAALSFQNDLATQFLGPGFQIVTITTLTSNTLVLQMPWSQTTLGPGRTKSISGNHEFVFSK